MVTRVRDLSTTSKLVIAVLALLIVLVVAILATTGPTDGGHVTQIPVQPNPYAGP